KETSVLWCLFRSPSRAAIGSADEFWAPENPNSDSRAIGSSEARESAKAADLRRNALGLPFKSVVLRSDHVIDARNETMDCIRTGNCVQVAGARRYSAYRPSRARRSGTNAQ